MEREGVYCVGDIVILRLPSNETKSVKLNYEMTISLGKFGSFPTSELVGRPYGQSYEIIEQKLHVIPTLTLDDAEETDATNELINDKEDVQLMTYEEIETLKGSGAHMQDIIQKQISNHNGFALKTEYSKNKYKRRKEAKFAKRFAAVDPTIHNICDYWFDKDRSRVRDIRADTLAQMMTISNVKPNGRYLVVDDASGLIVSAIFDRINGQGRIFAFCDVESEAVYHIMAYMNLPSAMVEKVLVNLNWGQADENYTPVKPMENEDPDDGRKNERQVARRSKRQIASKGVEAARRELFSGNFDALIMSTQYDAYSIADRLSPYLTGSAPVVVHSMHIQPIAEAQAMMRADDRFLGPTITEPWLRRYQVLPGRTHPFMTVSGSGGYLLQALKVYTSEAEYCDKAKQEEQL